MISNDVRNKEETSSWRWDQTELSTNTFLERKNKQTNKPTRDLVKNTKNKNRALIFSSIISPSFHEEVLPFIDLFDSFTFTFPFSIAFSIVFHFFSFFFSSFFFLSSFSFDLVNPVPPSFLLLIDQPNNE